MVGTHGADSGMTTHRASCTRDNGHIFYETLPPGILRKQIAANDAITFGNLTIQVKPDVYEAGARC